jgi:hypothetical protein
MRHAPFSPVASSAKHQKSRKRTGATTGAEWRKPIFHAGFSGGAMLEVHDRMVIVIWTLVVLAMAVIVILMVAM